MRHFYNAHFPGLYSIVLEDKNGVMKRAFIAKPGQLHQNLMHKDGVFFWHAHAYDFRETTLSGTVVNINAYAVVDGNGDIECFRYAIKGNMLSDKKLTLEKFEGKHKFICDSRSYGPGESYELKSTVVHRVVFLPCQKTGWFCCLVEELEQAPPPQFVYSPYELNAVPDVDKLYYEISQNDADKLVEEYEQATGVTLKRKEKMFFEVGSGNKYFI